MLNFVSALLKLINGGLLKLIVGSVVYPDPPDVIVTIPIDPFARVVVAFALPCFLMMLDHVFDDL